MIFDPMQLEEIQTIKILATFKIMNEHIVSDMGESTKYIIHNKS